jgi:hypothetical protein
MACDDCIGNLFRNQQHREVASIRCVEHVPRELWGKGVVTNHDSRKTGIVEAFNERHLRDGIPGHAQPNGHEQFVWPKPILWVWHFATVRPHHSADATFFSREKS